MHADDALVTRNPAVQGGAAVLAGTRMPVGSIVVLHRLYGGDRAKLAAAYPHLTEAQIAVALAYYERHRADIDADEERNARAFEAAASVA